MRKKNKFEEKNTNNEKTKTITIENNMKFEEELKKW